MLIYFENPLVLIPVSTGLLFIIAGGIMLKFPPKSINTFYGYRTERSMRDCNSWRFAQKFSAIQLLKFGGLLCLFGSVGFLYYPEELIGAFIGVALMILMSVFLILRVEGALKEKFDNNYKT